MKSITTQFYAAGLSLGLLVTATAQQPDATAGQKLLDAAKADAAPAVKAEPAAAAPKTIAEPTPTGMVRLNFQGAPLDVVLDYLSAAAD